MGCRSRPCLLDQPVVVSLTSYPKRYPTLSLTLKSLLRQTMKPDRLILWIAQGDLASLPRQVTRLTEHGLEIRPCRDIRSYKKLIPALEEIGDAHIVTADDDIWYWPTWLEALIDKSREHPGNVVAHRIRPIVLNEDATLTPYARWRGRCYVGESEHLNFPTGAGGVFYPHGAFHEDMLRQDGFETLCPSNDDIWFYWMVRMTGRVTVWSGVDRSLQSFPRTQRESLWSTNQTNNDAQISAMVKRYGFPAP